VTQPLWQPDASRVAGSNLTAFVAWLKDRGLGDFPDYAALHHWSVSDRAAFWSAVWDFCGVIGEKGEPSLIDGERMPGARFFPNASLNFAQNLLRRRDDTPALISFTEPDTEPGSGRQMTSAELYDQVSRCAQALRAAGVVRGDRVAAFVTNTPETIVAALASASIGAVWSSCSPDFGTQGVLDRFGQIAPKVFFAVSAYDYGGKRHDVRARIEEIASRLPSVTTVVQIPDSWESFLAPFTPAEIAFEAVPFNHPLYVLYSSGTTGVPKCIVHGHGGTLLQHLKEHQLQTDIKPGDRVFYFTTCGWMMWNWLITALASDATLVLYDGSPFVPDGNRLFDLADQTGITLFGTSAKFISAVEKAGLRPAETHQLTSVRTITSTGSPLAPESFDFVYSSIKRDVHLASISGGTDIVSCFVGGQPNAPVWRGEIQTAALGMDVDVWDVDGRPLREEPGELVCTAPFPSMPIGFWNDPDGAKYHAAYFDRFPGIWCHGDWIERTAHDGFIIYGRSDATLNPGGVRIGTSEIYRQVEQLPEVVESLAVGQQWEGDERIVLFVRLREGLTLDDTLRKRIGGHIRANTTPRHVPAKIVQVSDLPRTKSGKLVELAVRNVIHGRAVPNVEALANPDALALFRNLADLQA
jgi:acetoacetyl-CoA synthetase